MAEWRQGDQSHDHGEGGQGNRQIMGRPDASFVPSQFIRDEIF